LTLAFGVALPLSKIPQTQKRAFTAPDQKSPLGHLATSPATK
jgi:hypothetical protein